MIKKNKEWINHHPLPKKHNGIKKAHLKMAMLAETCSVNIDNKTQDHLQ
jgi:hypothetical protein